MSECHRCKKPIEDLEDFQFADGHSWHDYCYNRQIIEELDNED